MSVLCARVLHHFSALPVQQESDASLRAEGGNKERRKENVSSLLAVLVVFWAGVQ